MESQSPQTQTTPAQAADLERLLTVVRAIKNGHFAVSVPNDLTGPAREMAQALDEHLRMLRKFASEVHRITAEVGVIGRLGGQAEVEGARGSWWGMLSSLNHMAGCLTEQVRDISSTVQALSHGNTTRRVSVGCCQGEYEELKHRVNALADQRHPVAGGL